MKTCLLALFGLAGLAAAAGPPPVGYNISTPSGYRVLETAPHGGKKYSIDMVSNYDSPPEILVVGGSRYEMGFDIGVLAGNATRGAYNALLSSILGGLGPLEPAALKAFEAWIDMQWTDYLSVQVPPQYLEELRGLSAGGASVGVPEAGTLASRVLLLANMPGSPQDIVEVLVDEAQHPAAQATPAALALSKAERTAGVSVVRDILPHLRPGFQCSMLGVWGSRTTDGRVFSGRNLDWDNDTGINKWKSVIVYKPSDGGIAHATVGFSGLMGALTGMSAGGLTVHEANLEEIQETFRGFPWMLRLRYVMENAKDLSTAKALWAATNNTVGFNHGVASAGDASMLVMETKAFYTAYFRDDDAREANATWTNETTGQSYHIGQPMPEALWRTNHGYDPEIRRTFVWPMADKKDSLHRYNIIHDAILDYEQRGVKIGPDQAVNITAIVGSKGHDFYQCGNTHGGINVLSVAFDPKQQTMYAAWEAFSGANWRPACCNTFVKLDMSQFWH